MAVSGGGAIPGVRGGGVDAPKVGLEHLEAVHDRRGLVAQRMLSGIGGRGGDGLETMACGVVTDRGDGEDAADDADDLVPSQ